MECPLAEDIVLFHCYEDFCIDAAMVCDGFISCPNGADEEKTDDNPEGLRCRRVTKNCPYPERQIQCKKTGTDGETGQLCAGALHFCDGIEYCDKNGADEMNC